MDSTLSWRAEEHQHIVRGSDWYWALGIVAASCALTAILFGNVLFAIVIVVAAATFGIIASQPPRVSDFALTKDGLSIDDEFYPYTDMRAFWIEDTDEPLLLIDTPRFMTPDLAVPLNSEQAPAVHAILAERVPEVLLRESAIFILLETLGF